MPKIYVGSSGIARKSKKIYVGVNGTARRCKKIYVGDSNGKARLAYCDLPTHINLVGGYGKAGNFTYENQYYSKNTFDTQTDLGDIILRNPTEEIVVEYSGTYTNGSWTQTVTGGVSGALYAMPQHTQFWYGVVGKDGFNYSRNNAYTEYYNKQFLLSSDIVYGYESAYIAFTSPKTGTLCVDIGEFVVNNNPGDNSYALICGSSTSGVYTLSNYGNSNLFFSAQVYAGSAVYIGVIVSASSDVWGSGQLKINAIYII